MLSSLEHFHDLFLTKHGIKFCATGTWLIHLIVPTVAKSTCGVLCDGGGRVRQPLDLRTPQRHVPVLPLLFAVMLFQRMLGALVMI